MAAALSGRGDLKAIHVVAHGAPGRVALAGGDWTSTSLGEEADDIETIGRSLEMGGTVSLWSCQAGLGAQGADLIASLSRLSGRPVAAATHRIGARALGGSWNLNKRTHGAKAHPPLTEFGMGIFAGILIAEVVITGMVPVGTMGGPVTYYIVDTDKTAIVGQVRLPDAMPKATPVSMAVKVPDAKASLAIGTFDDGGKFHPADHLKVDAPSDPVGAVGPSGT